MATRYNNRKIVLSEQTLPTGKLLPGMIVTFNYSEKGVTDPRPILLFLHRDKETKLLEGLNINYINPAKVKKLFQVVDFINYFLLLHRIFNRIQEFIRSSRYNTRLSCTFFLRILHIVHTYTYTPFTV